MIWARAASLSAPRARSLDSRPPLARRALGSRSPGSWQPPRQAPDPLRPARAVQNPEFGGGGGSFFRGQGQGRWRGTVGEGPASCAARQRGDGKALSPSPAPGAQFSSGRGVLDAEPSAKPTCLGRQAPALLPRAALGPGSQKCATLTLQPLVPEQTAADPRVAAQLSLCAPQLPAGETRALATGSAEPSQTPWGSRGSARRNRGEST